ncbi:MAG: VOC family protein, partial [Bacteroidota bacterium]
MEKISYRPPNVLPSAKQRLGPLLRKKWVRKLILLPSTLSGKRFSNKTEDYGVFKPSLISHLDQLSIYVRDIAKSRQWYEELAGMTHSRTCEPEPHPFKLG